MEKAKGKKLFYRPAGKRKGMYTPTQIICVSFVIVIALGTFLLSLPVASKHGRLDVLDAMFTATSATCVTGLIVRDTWTQFTYFGQVVILLLIQVGASFADSKPSMMQPSSLREAVRNFSPFKLSLMVSMSVVLKKFFIVLSFLCPTGTLENLYTASLGRVGLVGAGHALHIDPDQAQFAQVCFLQQLHNSVGVACAVGVLVHGVIPFPASSVLAFSPFSALLPAAGSSLR